MVKNLSFIPPDAIFAQLAEFRSDANPNKVNLGIGMYSDNHGNPYVMPSVQAAVQHLDTSNFNYVGMQGDGVFLDRVQAFVLGHTDDHVAQIQTAGGTHACHLFGQIMRSMGLQNYILPTPTWGNYKGIFAPKSVIEFPHLNKEDEVDFQAYVDCIKHIEHPERTILVLHGGQAHNQTGKNLSLEQLKELLPLIKIRNLWTLIDAAYLGLGEGFDCDLEWVRTVFSSLNRVALATSFSKNACLYRHRCGALFFKTTDTDQAQIIESHLKSVTRIQISNPPAFGAMVMRDIFEHNLDTWTAEVEEMRISVNRRRETLIKGLQGHLGYLSDCRGMFGILDISPDQVQRLQDEFSVYVLPSGRINFSGLTDKNLDYVINSMRKIV